MYVLNLNIIEQYIYCMQCFLVGRPRDDRAFQELPRRTQERRVAALQRSTTDELGAGLQRRLVRRGDRPVALMGRHATRLTFMLHINSLQYWYCFLKLELHPRSDLH